MSGFVPKVAKVLAIYRLDIRPQSGFGACFYHRVAKVTSLFDMSKASRVQSDNQNLLHRLDSAQYANWSAAGSFHVGDRRTSSVSSWLR